MFYLSIDNYSYLPTYINSGKFTYLHILTVHLDDYTERGVQWQTWNNLGKNQNKKHCF